MIDIFINVLSLTKIFLLLITGMLLITEPRKKSLKPFGYLLFAISSDSLMQSIDSNAGIRYSSAYQFIASIVNANILRTLLFLGVELASISWLVLILITELQIRLLIKNK